MKLLTERGQIEGVADAWDRQYPPRRALGDISAKLHALDGRTATSDDVAAIIGNRSWVERKECDQCGTATWECVEVGQEPDYESRTAILCRGCLQSALALLDAAQKGGAQ